MKLDTLTSCVVAQAKLDPSNIRRDLFRWAGLVLLSQANGAIQV
jgi:hypothetical protein